MHIKSIRQAAAQCGISVATLKRLESAGRFPAKVRISDNRIGYLSQELDNWIKERAGARGIVTA